MPEQRPRLKQILIAVVSALRADSELAALLYQDPPPPAERARIHESWGGPDGTPPIEVVVEPVASGGEYRGGPLSNTTQLQCSVISTESWRDDKTALSLFGIRDRAAAVLESGVAPGVYPAGSGGQEGTIEVPGDDSRLLLPLTVEVRTHHMAY